MAKYYFPTTTLNFDSILSSQLIFPARLYRPDTLWWNRFTPVGGLTSDFTVLFNKCPVWDIDDPDRDNYPLVIEFSIANKKKYFCCKCSAVKGVQALLTKDALPFSGKDLMLGNVRFLFRNAEEYNRTVLKNKAGVAESKIISLVEMDHLEIFGIVPHEKGNTFRLDDVAKDVNAFAETKVEMSEMQHSPSAIADERTKGAELGYRVGRYVRSLRDGCFADAYRESCDFNNWKEGLLPETFRAVLEKLSTRKMCNWDPNRGALVQFCGEIWNDCFKGRKIAGKVIDEKSESHTLLREIAQHWANPGVPFPIAAMKDPYMQAFAVFLECGTNAEKYPRYAKERLLQSPEYLFSLYGALVGYTSFSRFLLENRNYVTVPDVSRQRDKDKAIEQPRGDFHPEQLTHNRIIEANPQADRGKQGNSGVQHQAMAMEPQNEEVVEDVGVQDNLFPTMVDGNTDGIPAVNLQLISDPLLANEVIRLASQFFPRAKKKQQKIRDDAKWFQAQYGPGGRYSGNSSENNDTVRHFVNYINRAHDLPESFCASLSRFLTNRYK